MFKKGQAMDLNPENMRARFHQLAAEIKGIESKSMPMREKRDAMSQASRQKEDAMSAEIKKIEAPLYDMKVEQAMVARALGGKTGKA